MFFGGMPVLPQRLIEDLCFTYKVDEGSGIGSTLLSMTQGSALELL